jgi:Spy/CpxP family protein refolding chaperone
LSSLAAILLATSLPLIAQESPRAKTTEKTEAPAAKRDAARRVPRYFGQIGLTPEQRDSIYKIQSKHQSKIEALQKQINEIQSQMLSECETVLTDTQKQLLQQRRQATGGSRKAAGGARTQDTVK